jgi:hypothetical protein
MHEVIRRNVVRLRLFAGGIAIASALGGCATVPLVQVERPWQRVLAESPSLKSRSSFTIVTEGESTPLLGDSRLEGKTLARELTGLLQRRGHEVLEQGGDYAIRLMYRSQSALRTNWDTRVVSASGLAMAASGEAGGLGLGVAAAQSVVAQVGLARSTVSTAASTRVIYTHILALEVRQKDGRLVWKGESMWDSVSPDVLEYAPSAIQLLVSGFPSVPDVRVEARLVRLDAVENYYREYCKAIRFACPALPNPIVFNPYLGSGSGQLAMREGMSNIDNPEMLAAYVDLVQTAEFAVPSGGESAWKNPVELSLWKRATIGGRYAVGSQGKPANVLIELSGTSSHYVVEKAKVVSDEEYARYESRLAEWRQALTRYFDVFEK